MRAKQQNLRRRFGTNKMYLSTPPPLWLRLLSVLRRWLCCSYFIVYFAPIVCMALILLCSTKCNFMLWNHLDREERPDCLTLTSRCFVTVSVLWLFLTVGWSAVCGCGIYWSYSKSCVKLPVKKDQKIGFEDQLSLNAGQMYCRMPHIRPSLSYQLSLRSLFCLFLNDRFTQALLYTYRTGSRVHAR